MRVWTLILLGATAFLGCDQVDTSAPVTVPSTQETPAPDNTAVNRRDADMDATKTPIDQDENQADVKRTAEIRKRIVDTPDLSVNARNVKVITSQGKVTLRGPVETEAERDTLAKIANAVAGEGNVDNQLEVKASSASPAPSSNPADTTPPSTTPAPAAPATPSNDPGASTPSNPR